MWKAEIIWWLFSFVLAIFLLYPLYPEIVHFPLLTANVLFILLGFHFLRLGIWWSYSPLYERKKWRIGSAFLSIPIIFWTVNRISDFIYYKDDGSALVLFNQLPFDESLKKLNYLYNEYLFLGVSATLAGLAFMLSMLWSSWRFRKWEDEED